MPLGQVVCGGEVDLAAELFEVVYKVKNFRLIRVLTKLTLSQLLQNPLFFESQSNNNPNQKDIQRSKL
ncbi:MAG: hypothetical protein H0Z28_12130 [Archaeoglobus sp.]|nr:hypothetical protein [Archaeoglobus sp.]